MKNEFSKEYLNSLFEYRDGEIFWKKLKKGIKAGYLKSNGYIYVCIDGNSIGIHRVIYMMHYGYLPSQIDHWDNNSLNNCIENLRAANFATNQWNRPLQKNNTSGYKNVFWNKNTKNWQVQIRANNKKINIGYFNDIELADLVAQEARTKYHGNFAKHF